MGLMRKESLEEEYSKILDDLGIILDTQTETENIKEDKEKQNNEKI